MSSGAPVNVRAWARAHLIHVIVSSSSYIGLSTWWVYRVTAVIAFSTLFTPSSVDSATAGAAVGVIVLTVPSSPTLTPANGLELGTPPGAESSIFDADFNQDWKSIFCSLGLSAAAVDVVAAADALDVAS